MELAAVCKKRQFNLENLTTNSALEQSKSMEITKDLVLTLQIYRVYEKKGREEYPAFLRKKEGQKLTKGGTSPSSLGPSSSTATTRHTLPIDGTTAGVGAWDLLFLWRDHDSGALLDFFL
jgi:hypothetical protein